MHQSKENLMIMKEKLKWNAIGLARKTQILRDYMQNENKKKYYLDCLG